ncbi:hypothetical protein KAU11_04840, partial [Candidatus Babeliales bacterium]|nr:hypothetical protein [Candidatus Babeliales bacterium]
ELEKEKIEMLIEQKLIVLPKCSNSTSTHKSVNEINRNRLDNFITKLKALTLKDLSDIPIGIKFLEDKIKKLKNKMKIEIPDFSIETEGRIAFVGNVTNKFEKQEHKKNKVILLYDNIKKCDKQMKILRKYQENKWLLNESRVVPKGVVPEIESFIECCYKVNEELVKDKKYKKGMLHTPESEKAVRSFLNDPLWACVYNENSQERQKSIR